MILGAETIRRMNLITPCIERGIVRGRSFGLSLAGYDLCIAQNLWLEPGEFQLASSVERFKMDNSVMGFVKDKSSWARIGLSVFNTVIEPGWEGYLTLELVNHGYERIQLLEGDPVAQVIFQVINTETKGYTGKYNHQEQGPQGPKNEI